MIKLIICSIFICLAVLNSNAQYKVYQDYVELHKEIAVTEMHRTGIPASIKLAQALLESNAGRSDLATKANNHFGIKCGGDWSGGTYRKEDDDYDSDGLLTKSCFRAFSSTEESFIAHSEFLRNPSKMNRYGFLFNLKTTDYKGWATGLRKAGYATDPNYASRLIKIVEDYQLAKLDVLVSGMDIPILAQADTSKKSGKNKKGSKVKNSLPKGIIHNNEVKMIFAQNGDTPEKISQRTGYSASRIISYNEKIMTADQVLASGERVYLSRKKSGFRGRLDWHYVKKGESMYTIAQTYGIRLAALMSKNRLQEGEEPAIGARIKLRWRIDRDEKPTLRTETPNILPEKPLIKTPDPDVYNTDELVASNQSTDVSNPEKYHYVLDGDTLYSISRQYNLSLDRLKSLNNLDGDLIRKGQRLKIR
jgi:LysM repeat protein